jgi:endonuclease/exonuclease/phosphatase family metal-dependent hydrolase
MPTYNDLRPKDDLEKKDYALIFPKMLKAEKKRTIKRLFELREGLRNEITLRRTENNLLLASWNIKEFGHTTQRLPEAYFYIAEILSSFDLVVIQEVKSTLKDLYIVMSLLGSDWSYIVNDITEGSEGNDERSAFVFNKKRVEFAGLAGEITLWDDLTQNYDIKQLKRTPYITGFKSGWKTFSIICLHLHPGESDDDLNYRRTEVTLLLEAVKEKILNSRFWNDNIILAGDFNLYEGPDKDDATIQSIYNEGFKEVESLKGIDTNASQTEAYDRLFLRSNEYFTLGKNDLGLENGGVFNPFNYVYKTNKEQTYKKYMKQHYTGNQNLDDPIKLRKYYKHPWRKNQISDHFPIWVELIIDSSDDFLKEKLDSY